MKVVITGQIRDAELFQKIANSLNKLQKENYISEIHFSTWQPKSSDDIFSFFHEALPHWHWILTPEPSFSFPGNFIFQMIHLYNGTRTFKNNDLVLKTRADLLIEPQILIDTVDRLKKPKFKSPFSVQVAIPYFEITKPFYIGDEIYLGYWRDLKKLINFNMKIEAIGEGSGMGITHVRRYAPPFSQIDPVFRGYVSHSSSVGWDKWNQKNRFEYVMKTMNDLKYIEMLAGYYHYLTDSFLLFSNFGKSFGFKRGYIQPNAALLFDRFEDNIGPETVLQELKTHIFCSNSDWLEQVVSGNMEKTVFYTRFLEYLKRYKTQ